jgi:hypothetical protein
MQSPSFCKRADALQVCTGDDTCGVACQVSPLTSPFFFFSFSPHFSGKFGFLKIKMLMHIIINLLHSTSISFYKYKKSLRKKKGVNGNTVSAPPALQWWTWQCHHMQCTEGRTSFS